VEIAVNSFSLVNGGGWEEREAGSEKPGSASPSIDWHRDANLGSQVTELRKRFSTKTTHI
jgi:hypothetical protein